jgi:hypothetical protein
LVGDYVALGATAVDRCLPVVPVKIREVKEIKTGVF